jgi:hypothetical protein
MPVNKMCRLHTFYFVTVKVNVPIQWPTIQGMDLLSFDCWDCWFESCLKHSSLFLVSVVCCQVEIFVSDRSLIQRSATECCVSECDHEASTMRRLWSTWGCHAIKNLKDKVVPVHTLRECGRE